MVNRDATGVEMEGVSKGNKEGEGEKCMRSACGAGRRE
jgi:hypothetical protein